MEDHIQESDWKYMRGLNRELLETLSRRINNELRAMLARADLTENEKRNETFRIVQENDRIVSDCFDAWKRSNLDLKCMWLQTHGLLTQAHRAHLSEKLLRLLGPLPE